MNMFQQRSIQMLRHERAKRGLYLEVVGNNSKTDLCGLVITLAHLHPKMLGMENLKEAL